MATTNDQPLRTFMARLEDLLPPGDAGRILPEVEGMVLDRIEAEQATHPDGARAELERAALSGWKTPEQLADELINAPLRIDWSARRAFVRTWAVFFAVHLVLAIVLTVAGSDGAAIPGFLAPLPRAPWIATVLGALSILVLDAGLVLILFTALRRFGRGQAVPRVHLGTRWTRRSAIEGLVLTGLIALIANVFRDTVFALREGDRIVPLLAAEVDDWMPLLNGVLALFAVRHVVTLAWPARRLLANVVEALACLAAGVLVVTAATSGNLVQLASGALGTDRAQILDDVLERVFLVVLVIGALLLAVRLVRTLLRLSRLLGARA